MRAVIWLLLALVVIGCSESDDIARVDASRSHKELHGNLIRAGFGIATCYIGMPVEELGDEWQAPAEPAMADEHLCNKLAGIDVIQRNGRIGAVFFYYRSKDSDPYRGKTEEDISTGSSLNQIREKYGDPSYIGESEQSEFGEFPGEKETVVDYVERGISFQFIGDRLANICIRQPDDDFDYEGFADSLGSWLTYVRKSQN